MRSYRQYCGLARALDIVGDRWNLLIVRQLLIAPARYQELLGGLPGIATNLLADRLRDLETEGVIERRLPDTGNGVIYALTDWGAALREPVEGLIRWSTPLMIRGADSDQFRPHWLGLALSALLTPRARGNRSASVGIVVDGETIQLRADRTGVKIGPHDGRDLDATVHAGPQIILGLAAGVLSIDDLDSQIDIQGDKAAVRAILGG
jgi:DNA-binding HxlR family transcriptional regulator